MSITKKCAAKLIIFNEIKLRKILMIFDIENWVWKSNFGTFWQLTINPKLNHFPWVYEFLGKNLLYPLFKNSTTRIAITHSSQTLVDYSSQEIFVKNNPPSCIAFCSWAVCSDFIRLSIFPLKLWNDTKNKYICHV